MENTKIFLDVDDEITFIIEKINASSFQNIILIIPEGSNILESISSLRLIYEIFKDSAKKLVFVTRDKFGKILIDRAGFSVCDRVGEVTSDLWLEGKKKSLVVDNNLESINTNIINDIDYKSNNIESSKPKFVESVKIVKLDDFDLVVGGDAAVIKSGKIIEKNVLKDKQMLADIIHDEDSGIIGNDFEVPVNKKRKAIKKIMKTKYNIDILKNKGNKYFKKWMIFPAIFILILGAILSFIFLPSAVVDINMNSDVLSQTVDVVGNVNNSIDSKKSLVPLHTVTQTESSSSSISTTGNKNVGNKSKGSAVIYNLTTSSIVLKAGTPFITNDSNKYSFTLDSAVTIPAANGSPQSQTGNLTASDIGSQYNIVDKTAFNIQQDSLPSGIQASANGAFTGGTSTSVSVVAQADQDNLLKSLQDQLNQKGKDELNAKITPDMHILNDTLKQEIISKSFDSQVGDKASQLNLSLSNKVSLLYYTDSDMKELGKDILQGKLSSDESLSNIKVVVNYKKYDSSTGNTNLELKLQAFTTPSLDTSKIKETIKFQSVNVATNYIKSFSGVDNVNYSISPFWFNWIKMLPFRSDSINVKVIYNKK